MDTASPVFRSGHVVRLAALLLALAFVATFLLVVLGQGVGNSPIGDEPLLGPFRWTVSRGLA